MRVTLHLGTHKTGTTSIQDSLAAARPWLLERGVLYPYAGCVQGQQATSRHMILSHAGDGSPRHTAAISALKVEMLRSGASHTVLSAEGWCTFKRRKRLRTLIRQLRNEGHEVEGVLFLRNRHRFARSHYREWTEVHGNPLGFAQYVQEFAVNWDYVAMVRRLNRLFDGHLSYLGFDDVSDSVTAFCGHVGVPKPPVVNRSNPSLDAVQTEIFRQLNAAGVEDPGRLDLDGLFADMPMWSDRKLYGEDTSLAELASSPGQAEALARYTDLEDAKVSRLLAESASPVYRIDALRDVIAARLADVRTLAA